MILFIYLFILLTTNESKHLFVVVFVVVVFVVVFLLLFLLYFFASCFLEVISIHSQGALYHWPTHLA